MKKIYYSFITLCTVCSMSSFVIPTLNNEKLHDKVTIYIFERLHVLRYKNIVRKKYIKFGHYQLQEI